MITVVDQLQFDISTYPERCLDNKWRLVVHFRLEPAYHAYERGEFALAQAHAQKVVDLQKSFDLGPANARAKQLLRICSNPADSAERHELDVPPAERWRFHLRRLESPEPSDEIAEK